MTDGTVVTVEIHWDTPGGVLGRWFDRLVGEPLLRRALRTNARRVRSLLAHAS